MKEKIKFLVTLFTRIVTCVLIFDVILLFIVKGKDSSLSLVDIIGIMFVALMCSVLYLPLLTDKTFSKRMMIFLNVAYFVIVNAITLLVGLLLNWFKFTNIVSFCALEVVIVATYVLVMILFYKVDVSTADKMNKKLKELDR